MFGYLFISDAVSTTQVTQGMREAFRDITAGFFSVFSYFLSDSTKDIQCHSLHSYPESLECEAGFLLQYDHVIAEANWHGLLTVDSSSIPCRVSDDIVTYFHRPPYASIIIIITGWCISPIWGCSAEGLSATGTHKINKQVALYAVCGIPFVWTIGVRSPTGAPHPDQLFGAHPAYCRIDTVSFFSRDWNGRRGNWPLISTSGETECVELYLHLPCLLMA